MLTLYVSRQKQSIVTADGLTTKVQKVYIRQYGKLTLLQCIESVGTISNVQLVISVFWGIKRVIQHNDSKLESAIVRFLQEFHARQVMSFDCYAFVNLVHSIHPHACAHLRDFWNTEPVKRKISPGTTIFLVTPGESVSAFHHAAVYIGYGLFVSVYGAGGDLEISTIRDMRQAFGGTQILQGIPYST